MVIFEEVPASIQRLKMLWPHREVPEKSLLWEKNLPDKNDAVYGKDFVCFETGCIGGETNAVRGDPDPWRVGRW
jgi:hypothetical protein